MCGSLENNIEKQNLQFTLCDINKSIDKANELLKKIIKKDETRRKIQNTTIKPRN